MHATVDTLRLLGRLLLCQAPSKRPKVATHLLLVPGQGMQEGPWQVGL